MIADGSPYANSKVPVQRVGEHLLPTAEPRGLWRPGLPVATPHTETVMPTCSATSFQVSPWSRSSTICSVDAECARGPERRIVTPARRS